MVLYLKKHLSITKKEWNGLVILVIVIALVVAVPYVDHRLYKDTTINAKTIDRAAATLTHNAVNKVYISNNKSSAVAGNIVFAKKPRLTVPVELNAADSARLTTIYGIGPSFARRIVKYRRLLGGFVNKEQLKEVYGLDAEKYAEIQAQVTVTPVSPKKVNVNTAGVDELKHLPYLTFKQKNAIVQYRLQHGDYASVNDMRDIAILDETTINKIKPYITFK
ncbi:MAG: hypothetical protein EOP47_26190 [Sphingobacteriaceae bacterium]|nr:MAG: hypothetical protein EOP47_26190 [Sphingobacteriaceae bacterium]